MRFHGLLEASRLAFTAGPLEDPSIDVPPRHDPLRFDAAPARDFRNGFHLQRHRHAPGQLRFEFVISLDPIPEAELDAGTLQNVVYKWLANTLREGVGAHAPIKQSAKFVRSDGDEFHMSSSGQDHAISSKSGG